MTCKEILKQVEEYYKMELHNIELVTNRYKLSPSYNKLKCLQFSASETIARCLGVALFVQQLDIDYEEITPLYDKYKELIEKELTELE